MLFILPSALKNLLSDYCLCWDEKELVANDFIYLWHHEAVLELFSIFNGSEQTLLTSGIELNNLTMIAALNLI